MRHLRFMLTFGFQNSDRTFFLTAKAVYILGGTLFFVAFVLHRLSVLFSQFNFELHQRHLYCCTLASENIFRTLPLLFRALLNLFPAYFEAFRRYVHTLCLLCLLAESNNTIVTFPEAVNNRKTSAVPCLFFVSL